MTLFEEQTLKLISYGVSKIKHLNDLTDADPELRALNDKQLAIVIICYAASLAKLTGLNLYDFLAIVVSSYQNVEISKKHADLDADPDGLTAGEERE